MNSFLDLFQGLAVMLASDPVVVTVRLVLVLLGFALVWLGRKGILEPLLMIPMGLGMATINVSSMFFDPINMANKTPVDETAVNNLFLDSTISSNDHLMTLMQIDWLQPVYTLTFSNGLIACLIFIGIGSLLDVGFVMKRPYVSAIIALFAELGTLLVLPLASLFGYNLKDAASIALVGGADGPMVLFSSLKLSPHLFVPITVVAYMYLGLAYGGFPYLVKLLVPKKLQAIEMPPDDPKLKITSGQKLTFAVVACVLLSFLFPVASPLFFSLFLGIAIRESGLEKFQHLVSEIVLYGSTLTLGLLLGVLCEAKTIMNPQVLPLLIFGMAALALSGVGGILGGYFMYFVTRGKVAQKCVTRANPNAIIMHYALGVNIFGVITTAIIAAIYISLLQNS